jgi:serpin B
MNQTTTARRDVLKGAVASVLLAGCQPQSSRAQQQPPAPPAQPPPAPSPDAARFGRAAGDFGAALLLQLMQATPTANVLISPLNIAAALAMIGQGARGATAANLADGLRLTAYGLTLPAAAPAFANLRARLVSSAAAEIELAGGLWVDSHVQLDPGFARTEAQQFGAQISSLDLGSPAAVQAVNQFVSDATHGKIPQVVGSLSPADVLVLAAVLYFKGGWMNPFAAADTHDAPFTTASGAPVTAPLMTQSGYFAYRETGAYQAVALPYADERFTMQFVLLKPGAPATAWAEALAPVGGESQGQVFIPRFKLPWGADLKGALQAMGLQTALGPGADYSGAVAQGATVGQVIHKTMLSVDEQGAEAVAATVIAMAGAAAPPPGPPPPPFVFRADRPFGLVLRERFSDAPLFMAYIASPLA